MVQTVRFIAYGEPVTQGSVSAYPTKGGRGVRTVSKTPALIDWRETVRSAAVRAIGDDWEPEQGDAIARLRFWLPRPKNKPKTRDVKPHTKDLDKLERAVYDSLTNAGVWTDDGNVVDAILSKRYCVGPHLPAIYKPDYHQVAPCVEVTISWYPPG